MIRSEEHNCISDGEKLSILKISFSFVEKQVEQPLTVTVRLFGGFAKRCYSKKCWNSSKKEDRIISLRNKLIRHAIF